MKKIAVLTTGGDAPGMNAAIRAVVRTAIYSGLEVYGVEHGFKGLMENKFKKMSLSSVSGIINKGGTILQTLRCPDFHLKEKREIAYKNLFNYEIDGIIIIGGDGSRKGTFLLTEETQIPSVFIPASIDNDVYGTDWTIGFDTAVNTGVEAIDKIRDTASSHERIFIVEVMGREHGFLALEIGLTGGAEIILIPEFKKDYNLQKICNLLEKGIKRGKDSSIIVMAEGFGYTKDLAEKIQKFTGLETRYTVLGYIQRGGRPTAFSRKLGLIFGYEAVTSLIKMKKNQSAMVGMDKGEIKIWDMRKVIGKEKKIDRKIYDINKIFAL